MKVESFVLPQFVETKLLDLFPKVAMSEYGKELPENFTTHTFLRPSPKGTVVYTVDGVQTVGCFDVYSVQQTVEKESV